MIEDPIELLMRNGNLGAQIPLHENHRQIDPVSARQRIRVYFFVGFHAPVECTRDVHLMGHEPGEEISFEDWAGNAHILEGDGSENAEAEEEIDSVNFVFDILEKWNARDKGTNWKGAGEVDESWEDSTDHDGETTLDDGGDPYLLMVSP
jgi:hypothetical protein